MNYFVSKNELLAEIAKAVDGIFSAVGRSMYELEHKIELLINVGIVEKRFPTKIRKRGEKMEEKDFEQLLGRLMEHVLEGEDEELIMMADHLQESFSRFKNEKEKFKLQLNKILERANEFLKKEGIEKKEKKEEKEEKKEENLD